MFDDARIAWVAGELPGGLAGRSVCEIGPFEGYQTRLLKAHGAGEVTSVEANTFNYLKCLCVREIYGFDADYLLGDGPGYLAACDRRFDLIFASGVLYHMQDPLGFLSAAAARTDHLFLWTHHFRPELLAQGHAQAQHFRPAQDRQKDWRGRSVRLHARSYRIADYRTNIPAYWEGGQEDLTFWLEREDLLAVLADLGLTRIRIGFDGEMEGALPVLSLLASRGG
ncbi:class I SAM-dependent methyltransferase [Neotabrizicola shimadae]|uniref:DUF1698 domain-containing protein n=1 Tax=Neotabrizicola shimadae TaxID=2807096 RepID=A0A8G1EEK4_9RHOB|nr:class I SAM-dependent methyltransferase [Neotabrizicola shimadae]QYZ71413.1 DUF1698 domain-containing protein [Neotabrizicola shimadae]